MTDYWFKPKTHGYGAVPSTWKGWAAIPAFMVAQFAVLWPWFLSPILAEGAPTTSDLVITLGLSLALIVGFIWLCKAKTEGTWAWRWGETNRET